MRAVRMHETGGPEVLRIEDIETPSPGRGQVLIRTAAAGVNFIDTYHRRGLYPLDLPVTLGVEGSGVVEAVGLGVEAVQEGDRVAYVNQQGSCAETALVSVDAVVAVPHEVDLTHAAALMLQGCTAHYLSHSAFPLRGGHTALVHAAAGGVGHLLVQLAKRRGARVIATASTPKVEFARRVGADDVIDYTKADFHEQVKELTSGLGVDVVYDAVGRDTFHRSLECLRPRGYMVLYGQSSGSVEPVDPQVLNRKGSLFLTRPSLAHYLADREELQQRSGDLFRWLTAAELEVRIDRTLPLEGAAEAHRYLEDRRTTGKLLLVP
ncbi:MAG: quinone oxidoreductase [Nitriliruptorales bacterium]